MTSWRRPLLLVAVGALLVTACGGGASPSPSATPPGSAAQASVEPSATPAADICTNPPKAEGKTLTFAGFGGTYQDAQRKGWLEPYSKLTGVKFLENQDSSFATLKAQVEAGQVTWDVAVVANNYGLDADAALLEPLDYSKIHKDEILDGFAGMYRVASITTGLVLGYNTDKVGGQVPQGWADFFDTAKFPGKRGVYDYSGGGIFEIALLADGVAPKDLYPLDLPRAIKKLNTIKNDLVFWSSGAQSADLLSKGEVALSMMWNGRVYAAKNTNKAPVEIQWNQEIVLADYFVVPKGSPNKDLAMDFIAWATCKENNAAVSKYIPYGPTNKLATADPSTVADLPMSHADAKSAYTNDAWLLQNAQLLEDTYQAWKTQ